MILVITVISCGMNFKLSGGLINLLRTVYFASERVYMSDIYK